MASSLKIPVATWVSGNLELGNGNSTLESIMHSLTEAYPAAKENISECLLSKTICAVFPSAKKSSVRERDSNTHITKKKASFKGINICTNLKQGPAFTLQRIHEFVPPEWFVINKNEHLVTFGKLSEERFNGNPVLLKVNMNMNGLCSLFIGDRSVDLFSLFISPNIEFTSWSMVAFFRCLNNAVRLCCGHESLSGNFQSTPVGVIECFTVRTEPKKTVIRHVYCDRVVSIQATIKSCKKCSKLSSRKASRDNDEADAGQSNTSSDIRSVIRGIAPNLSENQLLLMETQLNASNKSAYGMRWPKEVISMALSIFNRNPSSYRVLCQNGWLQLPSERLLSLYKNAVNQKPGSIPEMLLWMTQEANRQQVPPNGMYGGLIMDEMSIQEDISITQYQQGNNLVGLADSGKECLLMQAADNGHLERKLANHVLQYLFHGLTGFRWPFANYPNTQAPPAELFVTAWKCIEALEEYGFHPIYCCMDGSSNNRAFLKMHFPDNDLLASKMVASHYKNPFKKLIFIMDPCHLLKKIRNSILTSGHKDFHTRVLTWNSNVIVWQMWIDSYLWDRHNPFPVHNKLTDEHIFPNNARKMRNKLAFDVLDKDMLHLMKTYLDNRSTKSDDINAAIALLENTSFLVDLFADNRPIKDLSDERLLKLSSVYSWFKAWENAESHNGPANKRYKSLLTMETREDIAYMYHGFMSLAQYCTIELKHSLVPSRINSDIIENVFCQQRSLYHGATTNPTYNPYRTGINSVILGQSTISRKSNAGGQKAEQFAKSAKLPRL